MSAAGARLQLLYFAGLREKLGTAGEQIELPAGVASVAGLRAHLMAREGAWREALSGRTALRIAVNQDMARDDTPLGPGDEVAFFPPVTGG